MNDGYSIFAGTIADLTYPEVEAAAERGDCVLLPTGVIEQHGPHLPLGTDAYGAYQLSRLVWEELEHRGVEALIAPPVFWGINQVSSAFPGTFRTRPETAVALHTDILDSLATNGFDRIFVINHQGDIAHNQMLLDVVQRQHEQGRAGRRAAGTRLYRRPARLLADSRSGFLCHATAFRRPGTDG